METDVGRNLEDEILRRIRLSKIRRVPLWNVQREDNKNGGDRTLRSSKSKGRDVFPNVGKPNAASFVSFDTLFLTRSSKMVDEF